MPVEKGDLGDRQTIADTFHDAKLIPRAIDGTDVKLWRPGSRGWPSLPERLRAGD